MNRSRSIFFVAACSVIIATAFSSSSLGARHGGHGGGGHGGGGHAGGGHAGGGHGGGRHGGGGHGGHGGGGHSGHSSHRGGHSSPSRSFSGHSGSSHSGGRSSHSRSYSSHSGGHHSGHSSHSRGTSLHVGGLGVHTGGHGGHTSVHVGGLGVHTGGHGGHTSVHLGGHNGHGSVYGGGHYGGHYGGHHGDHYGGHSTHFGFHLYPWYAGVGLGYGGGGYGYSDRPYYASYSPVIVQPVVAHEVITESQPLAAETQVGSETPSSTTPDETTTPEGLYFQRYAEEAFLAGRYQESARHAQHALVEMPRNGKLHLFMSQTLFAIGDYQGAAGTIHQGVSLLDSKDWGYVVENYKNFYRGRDFVTQMEQLNEYLKQKPEAAYAHFVRGYQHGFLGHKKTAIKELTMAVELESRDQLASQLLERFGGNTQEPAEPAKAPPESEVKP